MKKLFKRYRRPFILMAFSLGVGLAPVFSVFLSMSIAGLAGCNLNEGMANSCFIVSTDWGEILTLMFIMGWFAIISLPLGVLGLTIGIIWVLVRLVLDSRKNLSK